MKVSKQEVLTYIEGLRSGDYESSESVWWRIHSKLNDGKDLEKWMKKYKIEN